MAIVRWFMGHPIVVLILVGAISGAVYWDRVGPELADLGRGLGLSKDKDDAAVKSAGKVAPSKPVLAAPAARVAVPAVQAPMVADPIGQAREEMEKRLQEARQRSDSLRKAAEAEMMKSRKRAEAAAKAAAPKPLDPALLKGLAAARNAYAQGDAAKAIAAYEALMRDFADAPDVPGELGNLYYMQGKLQDAAGNYLEAGLRLIKKGPPSRAGSMLGVLTRLDPEKAAFLRRKMFEAARNTKGASR